MLKVKIAKTREEVERGLMFVKKLPIDEGMLFIFKNSQKLNFWGANTYIPLDIAFIKDNTIKKIDRISPLSLKSVCSDCECDMALEVNSGFFDKNKVKVGSFLDIKDNIIHFRNEKNSN